MTGESLIGGVTHSYDTGSGLELFWFSLSLIRTMDVADLEDMTWSWQLLSTDYKHYKV